MKRREFFSMMAGAGLCATAAGRGALAGLTGGGTPVEVAYEGPMFITFAADGGWDPTGFCDPHSNLFASYGNGDITTAGGISYPNIANNQEFFTRFADKLLVLNGVDTSTNNHSIGRRHVWTGRQDATHPHWAALAAGSLGPGQPLAFIGEASQSATEGVVARSRVSNSDVLQGLSFPNKTNPADPENLATFHSEPAMEMIEDWRNDRLVRLRDEQNLPKIDHALSNVITTRTGSNELELLQSYLPEPLADNQMRRQIQIALAAYKAGIAISATFGMNGFRHPRQQRQQPELGALDVVQPRGLHVGRGGAAGHHGQHRVRDGLGLRPDAGVQQSQRQEPSLDHLDDAHGLRHRGQSNRRVDGQRSECPSHQP